MTELELSANHSELWGVDGERFTPAGRLFDWSYAGYRAGERPIPTRAATINVKDRGATGNGSTNDTNALVAAVAAAMPGDVVYLPAGTYVLRARLELKTGVVLKGDGPDQTILDVPVNLTDLYGNPGLDAGEYSSYSFTEGFISAKGRDAGALLATVTGNARRGDKLLRLSTTANITVGQWIHLDQTDVGGALINNLYVDMLPAGTDSYGKVVDFYSRVTAVTANAIELERTLPLDVEVAFSPKVYATAPTHSEVGVEGLTVRFPRTTYPGHFNELGYNGIYFFGVHNSWIKNVKVVNGDYGVGLKECQFVTVEGAVIDSTNARTGHHALNNTDGNDNLFTGFDVRVEYLHDLTSEWYSTGIVFTKGRGVNLCLDHHTAAPYCTLWTELDLGSGRRPWASGGRDDRGANTAAYDTLWNVRASAAMALPPNDYGPRMNFVGFQTNATRSTSPYDWWLERIAPASIDPPNLWEAMRERRLAGLGGSGAGGAAGAGGFPGGGAGGLGGSAGFAGGGAAGESGGAFGGGAGASGLAGQNTGGSAGTGGSATLTGGMPGAGGSATSGGAGMASGFGGGAGASVTPPDDPNVTNEPDAATDAGCGCVVGARRDGPAPGVLGALFGLTLLGRARRRARSVQRPGH